MKYLLLIHSRGDTEKLPEEEQRQILGEYIALAESPEVLSSHQLQPADTATTVRIENGQTLTTDGPFADTKEVLGGLYLLEADNLDVALDLAARIPAARMGGAVEVRPLVER